MRVLESDRHKGESWLFPLRQAVVCCLDSLDLSFLLHIVETMMTAQGRRWEIHMSQVRHFAGVPSTWSISSLEQKQQRKQTQDINNQIGFPVLLAHHRVVAGKGSCSQMSFCLCSSSWGRRYLLISLERETQEPCSPPIRL